MKNTPVQLYNTFLSTYGPQHWWPMDSSYHKLNGSDPRFEVIIGAILTQNTAWSNVEKAIYNLKQENMLHISSIAESDLDALKKYIRPSGFFNQKAKRLQTIASYLKKQYQGDLTLFFDQPLQNLRQELLRINGIGPETADSILLYAGNKPIFVVDAYTKRLFGRLNLLADLSYDQIQSYVESDFSQHFSVEHAKRFCRKKPLCTGCPLINDCTYQTTVALE